MLTLSPTGTVAFSIEDRIAALRNQAKSFGNFTAAVELAKALYGEIGPTLPVLNEVRALDRRNWWIGPNKRIPLRAIEASICCERGDRAGANRILTEMWDVSRSATLRYASLASLAQLHSFGVAGLPVLADCAEAMLRADENDAAFQALLADRSVRIAVVGNSPIELGRGRGAEIDAHDHVIRFNNFSEDTRYAVDYGTKASIWMKAGGYSDLWRRPTSRFDYVLFSGPDRRYHGAQPWDVLDVTRTGGRAAFVPTRISVELGRLIDRPPSAGLLLLYWLRVLRGRLGDANVSVYGFSLTDQTDGMIRHYFAPPMAAKKARHDWSTEARFLAEHILA